MAEAVTSICESDDDIIAATIAQRRIPAIKPGVRRCTRTINIVSDAAPCNTVPSVWNK